MYIRKIKLYYLDKPYGDLFLTQREADCVHLFVKGHNIESAAHQLNLSQLAVNFYLKNIQHKFSCNTLEEVIMEILKTDFLKVFEAEECEQV